MQETKKGGPYNKADQNSRRNEVSRLYFEYGYSARKIAEMMKVNRNTINADIKYLYSNIKEEIKENSEDFVLRQIGRLEAQRNRITESIRENNIDDKIKYEKLLLEIDSKMNNLLSKISLESKSDQAKIIETKNDKIQEEEISDFILFLVIKYSKDPCIEKKDIISEIVSTKNCTINESEKIFLQIEELGLVCCRKFRSSIFVYDLLEFAYLRRYLPADDPFVTKIQELCFIHNHFDAEKMRLKQKFEKEYKNEEGWTKEKEENHDKEYSQCMNEHAKSSSKIIVEAIEKLSNQEEVEKYLNCINVFFGKEDKPMFEKMLG